MAPKSMSSEVENIELKSKEKTTRTNSICPCFYFNFSSFIHNADAT